MASGRHSQEGLGISGVWDQESSTPRSSQDPQRHQSHHRHQSHTDHARRHAPDSVGTTQGQRPMSNRQQTAPSSMNRSKTFSGTSKGGFLDKFKEAVDKKLDKYSERMFPDSQFLTESSSSKTRQRSATTRPSSSRGHQPTVSNPFNLIHTETSEVSREQPYLVPLKNPIISHQPPPHLRDPNNPPPVETLGTYIPTENSRRPHNDPFEGMTTGSHGAHRRRRRRTEAEKEEIRRDRKEAAKEGREPEKPQSRNHSTKHKTAAPVPAPRPSVNTQAQAPRTAPRARATTVDPTDADRRLTMWPGPGASAPATPAVPTMPSMPDNVSNNVPQSSRREQAQRQRRESQIRPVSPIEGGCAWCHKPNVKPGMEICVACDLIGYPPGGKWTNPSPVSEMPRSASQRTARRGSMRESLFDDYEGNRERQGSNITVWPTRKDSLPPNPLPLRPATRARQATTADDDGADTGSPFHLSRGQARAATSNRTQRNAPANYSTKQPPRPIAPTTSSAYPQYSEPSATDFAAAGTGHRAATPVGSRRAGAREQAREPSRYLNTISPYGRPSMSTYNAVAAANPFRDDPPAKALPERQDRPSPGRRPEVVDNSARASMRARISAVEGSDGSWETVMEREPGQTGSVYVTNRRSTMSGQRRRTGSSRTNRGSNWSEWEGGEGYGDALGSVYFGKGDGK